MPSGAPPGCLHSCRSNLTQASLGCHLVSRLTPASEILLASHVSRFASLRSAPCSVRTLKELPRLTFTRGKNVYFFRTNSLHFCSNSPSVLTPLGQTYTDIIIQTFLLLTCFQHPLYLLCFYAALPPWPINLQV